MNTLRRAISTTHEVEVLPVEFDGERFAIVPLEFCPGIVAAFTCLACKDNVEHTFRVAHVIAPGAGREAYLYPAGDEFAHTYCEALSREKR